MDIDKILSSYFFDIPNSNATLHKSTENKNFILHIFKMTYV